MKSGGLDWGPAEELLQKLPEELQREAAVDLQRRWQPVLAEWLQRWDHDNADELEPEEPLSDEESEDPSPLSKRRRISESDAQHPMPPSDNYPDNLWPHEARQGIKGFNTGGGHRLLEMLNCFRSRKQWPQ